MQNVVKNEDSLLTSSANSRPPEQQGLKEHNVHSSGALSMPGSRRETKEGLMHESEDYWRILLNKCIDLQAKCF